MKELIFHLQRNHLSICILQNESLRSPAMALERPVGIFHDKILTLMSGRNHLIKAAVEEFEMSLRTFNLSGNDVVCSHPDCPACTFRSIYNRQRLNRTSCSGIHLAFSPYNTDLVPARRKQEHARQKRK